MARLARKRHLRHGDFERTERSKHLHKFLNSRAVALDSTGESKVFTISTNVAEDYASGVVTFDNIPTNLDEIVVGSRTYKFVTTLTSPAVPDEIEISTVDAATNADNFADAINGDLNTAVSAGTSLHDDVTASLSNNEVTVVSYTPGAASNGIITTTTGADISWANATLTGGVDQADGTGVVTVSSHGFRETEGPFVLSSPGTLPLGLDEGGFYWIQEIIDANTFKLTTKRGSKVTVIPGDAGSGTFTMTKADTKSAFYEYLRQNAPEVVRDATDVDDL